MHMTLETDYAVRIVSCLVTAGRRMDAKSIAEETSVTLRFSLKILRKLVAGGIIKSYKGTQGGYELAREPKEISLNDVIETGRFTSAGAWGETTNAGTTIHPPGAPAPSGRFTTRFPRMSPSG